MASQTITNTTRNYDDAAISGLLNGETIILNNSNLIINSDSRWGQQSCVMGSVTLSSSLGGNMTIDGRDVWWIPFDASTGVVPSLGVEGINDVTGSITGVGEFLGIFPTTMLIPVAAGVSIPSTGFLKLRKKTSSFADNEIITFSNGATITINSTTGGQVGWIHVVGVELGTITVPRLAKFTSIGNYFELGITNGADDQTFQFPIADTCPAFQMETSVGSGVYEWWINAGDRWGTATQFVATDERGKFFGINKTTGVITIAQRASNACGYKPITGLRVRIPNIIISSSSATNWNNNLINTTIANRYDFTTTNAGELDIQHLCGSWALILTSAYSVNIQNCALLNVQLSNLALPATMTNIGFGMDTNYESYHLSCVNLLSGITIDNIVAFKYASLGSNGGCISMTDSTDIEITNSTAGAFGAVATTERGVLSVRSFTFSRCSNVNLENISSICGNVSIATCNNVSMINHKYAERLNGTTSTILPNYSIEITAYCNNVYLEGFSYLYPSIANLHSYNGTITCSSSNNIKIINYGTPTSKISGGTVNQPAYFLAIAACNNVEVRRCYYENIRTVLISAPNNNQNITIENVWGDGTDILALASSITTVKGGKWTGSQAGQSSVYGKHFEDMFISNTDGTIYLSANEPVASTASQLAITAGTPKYNSVGGVQMPTVGDQITWTMPYYAIGHTGLGGNLSMFSIGTLLNNLNFDYQIDTGSGFSAWKDLMSVRYRSSGGTAGTNTFAYGTSTGSREPQIGDHVGTVLGTHIPLGTTVTNIVGTTVTLSNNISVAIPNGLAVYFWNVYLTEPAINPVTGVKFKVRATTMIAGATTNLYYVSLPTTTTLLDQQIQYPLPVPVYEAKISGMLTGSRIRVYNVSAATEIANEVIAGTEWSINYAEGSSFTSGDVVSIRISKIGYLPNAFLALATDGGVAGLAEQSVDDVYAFNAIDGSTVTELSADFPNIQVDSTDVDGETTVQRIYAWFSYIQTTEQGIRDFFQAVFAEDEINYRVNSYIANLKIDNTISTPLMVVGGRIYRDDNETIIAATSNSIQIDPYKAYIVDSVPVTIPTVDEFATAVWAAPAIDNVDVGSMGELLEDSGGTVISDPWDTTLPASYTSDKAGFILDQVKTLIEELHKINGLTEGTPVNRNQTSIKAGDINIDLTYNPQSGTVLTRND